ncbi:MAG: ATP-dependent zinc metalloprotease FtsH [Bacilli bacterium]|nr:ATP-dependent zinc metalloprotease FtsH [Bacilli bacterium]
MANSKQPKTPKRSNIILIVVMVLMAIAIVYFFTNLGARPEELTVGRFLEVLDADSITEITATPYGDGANQSLYNITGIYKVGGVEREFHVVIGEELKYQIEADAIGASYIFENKGVSTFNWLSVILTLILPILLFVGIIFFMMKSAGSSNNKAFEFGKNRALLNRKKTTTFKDVAGCDEEKEELEEVIDFLKTPKKYFEIGARIPKGILLSGPPGTGKTLLARAVAGEANVPFYSISGSDFVEMFVGVGASRVRDMFKVAKKNAPCLIFIDEIDAVGRQRGAGLGGGHDEREQTLNQLLAEMDGFSDNNGIIIIAATNRPDVLDPALLRPGRFDRQIIISNPDVKGRTAILHVHARNKKISPSVNFEDISKRTPGFSGADLENLLNEAALLAARENRKEVKIYDIDEAIDRVLMGPAKKSRKYSEKEKLLVSYHESGHAILGIKLDNAEIVQKVTIVPRGMAGGYSMMTPEEEHFLQTKQGLLDTITGLLGGRIAEDVMMCEITTGAHDDFRKATAIARAMVTEYGMSELGPIQYERQSQSVFLGRDYMTDKNFSDQIAFEIDHAVRTIIDECYKRGKEVLIENKDLLVLLAKHLMEIETLTKEDIYELVNTGKLSWWENKKLKVEAEKVAAAKEAELNSILEEKLKAAKEEASVDLEKEAEVKKDASIEESKQEEPKKETTKKTTKKEVVKEEKQEESKNEKK